MKAARQEDKREQGCCIEPLSLENIQDLNILTDQVAKKDYTYFTVA